MARLQPRLCSTARPSQADRLHLQARGGARRHDTTCRNPDVIVVMNADDLRDVTPEVRTATEKSLAQLTEGGRKVVIIEPNPTAPADMNPLSCLDTAMLEDCATSPAPLPARWSVSWRVQADESDQIWSADFDKIVCPYLPICDPLVGGIVVGRPYDPGRRRQGRRPGGYAEGQGTVHRLRADQRGLRQAAGRYGRHSAQAREQGRC